jgi:hypothetical protein
MNTTVQQINLVVFTTEFRKQTKWVKDDQQARGKQEDRRQEVREIKRQW